MSVELLANESVRRHLHEAAQEALAHELPRAPTTRPDVVARQYLASGLRALAARLDPCTVREPSLVVANPR
ncbi:MAG: hypothetical protein LC797_08725 [Chloroflexi bacterium]|nr:hypothetical protein [Chloroflexota bacterium]